MLEGKVVVVSGGSRGIGRAIAAYERGAKLRQHCEAKLAEAEQRLQCIERSLGHGEAELSGPDAAR